ASLAVTKALGPCATEKFASSGEYGAISPAAIRFIGEAGSMCDWWVRAPTRERSNKAVGRARGRPLIAGGSSREAGPREGHGLSGYYAVRGVGQLDRQLVLARRQPHHNDGLGIARIGPMPRQVVNGDVQMSGTRRYAGGGC